MDSPTITTILAATSSGLIAALGGTYIAHRFYIKRWQLERREVYKAELFKMKLKIYRDLLRIYSVMCHETIACFINEKQTESFIKRRNQVIDFVESNMLILAEGVVNLALTDYLEKFEIHHAVEDVAKIAKSQYLDLANACRSELGIDTISEEFKEMFMSETSQKNLSPDV